MWVLGGRSPSNTLFFHRPDNSRTDEKNPLGDMLLYDSGQRLIQRDFADHYQQSKLFLLSHMLDGPASGKNAPEAIIFVIVVGIIISVNIHRTHSVYDFHNFRINAQSNLSFLMGKPLIPAQRRERIQEFLATHKIVRMDDLYGLLDTSEETVRRDLVWLERAGIVE